MISAKKEDNYSSREMGIILANQEKKVGPSKNLGLKLLAGLSLLFSVAAEGGHVSAATNSNENVQTSEQTPNIQGFVIEYYSSEGVVSHVDCPSIVTSPAQMNKIIIDNVPRGFKINWEPGTSINTQNGLTTIGVDIMASANYSSPKIEESFTEKYDQQSTDVGTQQQTQQQVASQPNNAAKVEAEPVTDQHDSPSTPQNIPETPVSSSQDKSQTVGTDNTQQVIEQPTLANNAPEEVFTAKHADIY